MINGGHLSRTSCAIRVVAWCQQRLYVVRPHTALTMMALCNRQNDKPRKWYHYSNVSNSNSVITSSDTLFATPCFSVCFPVFLKVWHFRNKISFHAQFLQIFKITRLFSVLTRVCIFYAPQFLSRRSKPFLCDVHFLPSYILLYGKVYVSLTDQHFSLLQININLSYNKCSQLALSTFFNFSIVILE